MSDRCYRRREASGISGRDLGDEYLFYDQGSDRVHILNGTARSILMLCDGKRTVKEIAAAIATEYSVEEKTALQDAAEAIEQLVELGLIEPA